MLRRDTLWGLYKWIAVAISTVLMVLAASPIIEPMVFPVRSFNVMDNIRRSDNELCWDWHSVKRRDVWSPDIDVFVETPEERFPWMIWEYGTHMPWAKSRAVGVGPHTQSYCIPLPPNVKPYTHVKVKQKVWYPSRIGPWTVPVALPDVVSIPPGDRQKDD